MRTLPRIVGTAGLFCLLPALAAAEAPEPAVQATDAPATAAPEEPSTRNAEPAGFGHSWQDYLHLGGFMQFGYRGVADSDFDLNDADGFGFRAARLMADGKVDLYSDLSLGFRTHVDVHDGFRARDVYATLAWRDLAVLDFGQFKVPFGLIEITPDYERSTPGDRASEITVNSLRLRRDRGLQLHGTVEVGKPVFGWWLAAVNGDGEGDVYNQDSHYLFAGRIEVSPLGFVDRDEADLKNSPFGFTLGGSFAHTTEVGRNDFGTDAVGAQETRAGADARLKFRGLSLRGEWMGVKQREEPNRPGLARKGFYAQFGYVLPIPMRPQLEIVGKFQEVDQNTREDGYVETANGREFEIVDNARTRQLDVGANLYLFEHRLKLETAYRITTLTEGVNQNADGSRLFGNTLMIELQAGWFR